MTNLAELIGAGFSVKNVAEAKAQALAHDPCVTCSTICRTLDRRDEDADFDGSYSACCSAKCMDAYVNARMAEGEVLHNRRNTPDGVVSVLSFGAGPGAALGWPGEDWVCFVNPEMAGESLAGC